VPDQTTVKIAVPARAAPSGSTDHRALPISYQSKLRGHTLLFLFMFYLARGLSQQVVADAVFPAEYAPVVMPDLAAPHRLSIFESAEEQRRTELTSRCCQSFAADYSRSKPPVDFR